MSTRAASLLFVKSSTGRFSSCPWRHQLRGKKKVITRYGEPEVSKGHCMAPVGKKGFRVSEHPQELACYVGQQTSFDEASENLKVVGGVSLTDKQVERICHHHGGCLEQVLYEEKREVVAKDEELTYAMMDGSKCLIRREGWKEVKLGRVFKARDLPDVKERGAVRQSEYVAHLGSHTDFLDKFGPLVTDKANVVAIADGARWIWDFWDTHHPNAVQILDYFHAVEKIGCRAKLAIKKRQTAKEWMDVQEKHLLDGDVEEIINALEDFPGDTFIKEKQQLLTYSRNNTHRMRYKTFQEKGYLIGSGPIEAPKQVIQARLKKSGQRWTPDGLQQVANLRVAKHSRKWNIVLNQMKEAA